MDHEVELGGCKSVDWLMNISHDHFGYTKEKWAEGPWRSRSPKYNFQGIINALTWFTGFCGEGGGMVGKCRGPRKRNVVIDIFLMNVVEGLICTFSH